MKQKSRKEPETESIGKVIAKRRNRVIDIQGYISFVFRLAFVVLCVWLLFSQVFFFSQVKGNGMFPAVKDGDLLIGFRLQDTYLKDDIILCKVDGEPVVGRIVGRQGDVVGLDESGQLYINGTPQSGEIMYPSYAKEGIEYPYKVPDGHFFIMGDYRTQTRDSRDFGAVPEENVEGKVISLLRRRGL